MLVCGETGGAGSTELPDVGFQCVETFAAAVSEAFIEFQNDSELRKKPPQRPS
jgi:hypothetical protein